MAVVEPVDARQEVIKLRVRGQTYERIASKLGLEVESVKRYWREFLVTNYSDLGEVELRLTQLARLERMVDMVWDLVELGGDIVTEGKQTANLIKIIDSINELMGLHRDPLKEAQVQLTKAQTDLMHMIMSELRGVMLMQALEGVRSTTDRLGLAPDAAELLRTEIETQWSEWYAKATEKTVASVQKIEEARAKVGEL